MFGAIPDMAEEHEALMKFLFLSPVGLSHTSLDGQIAMINPISAQLLMPLLCGGDLTNLFKALESALSIRRTA